MATSLLSLLIQETQAQIYAAALSIAQQIGLPVTSWQPGDPTRSIYQLESQIIESLENVVVGFIQSGFLDFAAIPNADGTPNPWLAILAQQVFGVDVPDATFAETSVTLTNSSGFVYDIEPGDLTFSSSISGATYHNTTGGTLNGSSTLSLTVIADVAGTGSNAGTGEIDTLVTTLAGVTCSNPTAATGLDQQPAATTVAQCRAKLASLSPNGPAGAYSFVALNQTLTGTTAVTQARVYADSETGDVTIYVAGPSGAVSSGDVAAVQAAILKYATPLCVTPTVISAAGVAVPVTYTLWIYQSANQTAAQAQAAVQTALEAMFAARPIGGDIIPPATTGALYLSLIESTIGNVFAGNTFDVAVALPTADTALTNGQVPQLGTVTGTIVIVPNPQ